MFDAYTVAVKVALHDKVTSGLMGMSATFKRLGADAEAFQKKLAGIKKMAFIGAGIGGAGLLGLDVFSKMAKPAEEYAHLLNVLNIQGNTHLQIAQAIGAAWKTTGSVITSSIGGNLKTFIDLKNIFRGNIQEAISFMPEFAKFAAVLGAATDGKIHASADDLAYSAAKALDMRGAINPTEFRKESLMMAKVMIATHGRVLPQDYQMMFKYGRQATFGLSNEFLYEELPTLMMEMKTSGGGSGSHGGIGTSLAAGYRYVVQGIMTKAAHEALANIGLAGNSYNSALKTTTTRTILRNGVKGAQLFQYDPFQWTQDYLLPALHKKYGDNLSKQDLIRYINNLRMTQTASFAILQYALKSQQIYGDQKLIKRAMNLNDAYNMSLAHDPKTVGIALSAQWDAFKTAFMMGVVPVILPTLMSLTRGLSYLAQVLEHHRTLAKVMAIGFLGLFSAMSAVGTLLIIGAAGNALIPGFKLLRLAMIPLLAPLGEFAAALLVIYGIFKLLQPYWKEISGFIGLNKNTQTGNEVHDFSSFYGATTRQPNTHVHLNIDGKKVAHVVVSHMSKSASHAPAHGSSFNSSMNLGYNMLNVGQ